MSGLSPKGDCGSKRVEFLDMVSSCSPASPARRRWVSRMCTYYATCVPNRAPLAVYSSSHPSTPRVFFVSFCFVFHPIYCLRKCLLLPPPIDSRNSDPGSPTWQAFSCLLLKVRTCVIYCCFFFFNRGSRVRPSLPLSSRIELITPTKRALETCVWRTTAAWGDK